jgi:hypothetical protein
MTGVADIVVPALALLGGGAVGAALGGAALLRSDWNAARMRGVIAGCAIVGAVFGLVATVGVPMPALASLLPKFSSSPMADDTEHVLKTYYPDDYAQAQSTESTLKATGASQAQIAAALHRQMLSLMQRQMPLASNENTLAYLTVARDEQVFMAKSNPNLCYRVTMEPSVAAQDELVASMPDDMKQREASLGLKLLEQTATAPQPPKPSEELDGKLKIWAWDALNGLSFDERDALRDGGELHDKAACDAVGNLINMLVMMGGTDAVEAYKALSAKGLEHMSG